jgi:predicted dithiol-disulfide oxidoreductase (DUF899 family)
MVVNSDKGGTAVATHRVGTREQWSEAREALRRREDELNELSNELARQRRELPWVPVEKEYKFDTPEGPKTLAELFDGRSQLLIYHIMFGPDYAGGACPGCSNLADHLSDGVVHLNHRDVTFTCISRATLPQIEAYKGRMGWTFPWASSNGSDYQFDFGFALTDEQLASKQLREMIERPPDWLAAWATAVGTDLEHGLIEGPGWAAFALEDGVVYHTYSRHAPDGDLLAPYYYQLLDQVPHGRPTDFRATRHDDY